MVTKQWILSRLSEPSTWRGAVLFATGLGAPLNPEYLEHIVSVGLAVTGFIGVVTADKPKQNTETTEG